MLPVVAERVGFEPTYRLLTDNPISSRARYGQLRYLSAQYVSRATFLSGVWRLSRGNNLAARHSVLTINCQVRQATQPRQAVSAHLMRANFLQRIRRQVKVEFKQNIPMRRAEQFSYSFHSGQNKI